MRPLYILSPLLPDYPWSKHTFPTVSDVALHISQDKGTVIIVPLLHINILHAYSLCFFRTTPTTVHRHPPEYQLFRSTNKRQCSSLL
jgi:hypothetical protein